AENVEGLISMAQSNWKPVMEDEAVVCEEAEMVLETIRKDLEKAGYQSVPIVIPAAAVGASHRRYRVFIVAYSESEQNRRREQPRIQSDIGADRENVAYSASEGLQKWGQ